MKPIIHIRRVINIPEGLIVPYNSAGAAPSGWQLFATANNYYITCADSGSADYSVSNHGPKGVSMNEAMTIGTVDGTGTIRYYSNTGGYHGGMEQPLEEVMEGSGGDTLYWIDGSYWEGDGGHKHLITCTPTLGHNQVQLIQATSNQNQLPPNSLLLLDRNTDLSTHGLTQPFGAANEYLLKAGASISTAGNSQSSVESDSGGHDHNWETEGKVTDTTGSQRVADVNSISHGHSHGWNTTNTISPNMKRFYLSAWTKASDSFAGQNYMIGMWDKFTDIPTGWYICNGSNGTQDLRQYFITLRDKTSVGTGTGDNTISLSGGVLNEIDWLHSHKIDGLGGSSSAFTLHEETYGGNPYARHGHTTNFSYTGTLSFLPEYYSLVFIQKI